MSRCIAEREDDGGHFGSISSFLEDDSVKTRLPNVLCDYTLSVSSFLDYIALQLHMSRTPFFLLMSSSSSLITSHGVALATAVAVSGAVFLLAICRQKPFSTALNRSSTPPWCHPRSCMSSSEGRKRERANGKQQRKKRVQFAAEVEELGGSSITETAAELARPPRRERREARGMPANRVALYNGILRDRVMQRTACSY